MAKINVYHLLRHPIRRKIVTLLGEREKVGFTELKRDVDVGVGKLYYHLDVLSALITQDEHRKYLLTELGLEAYSYLMMGRDETGVAPIDVHVGTRRERMLVYILSRPFSFMMFDNPIVGVAMAVACVGLGTFLVEPNMFLGLEAGLEVTILIIRDVPSPDPAMIILRYVLSILFTFFFLEVVSRAIFKRGGGSLSLFISTVFSYVPLLVFSAFWLTTVHVRLPAWLKAFQPEMLHLVFFAFEGWTLLLLTYTLNVTKRIKLGSAAAIILVLVYLSMTLSMVPSYLFGA